MILAAGELTTKQLEEIAEKARRTAQMVSIIEATVLETMARRTGAYINKVFVALREAGFDVSEKEKEGVRELTYREIAFARSWFQNG